MELSCVADAIILRVDDAALFRSTRRGDESAFCELFDRYQRRLYQYAAQMYGSAAADDIVQETFLAVLKADGFDSSIGTLAAYLFGIARHHVIRRLTKQGTLLESSYVRKMASPGPQETPFDVLAREEAIAAVRSGAVAPASLPRDGCVMRASGDGLRHRCRCDQRSNWHGAFPPASRASVAGAQASR